jgi:DNA-binding transcriptional ArsR family regulator
VTRLYRAARAASTEPRPAVKIIRGRNHWRNKSLPPGRRENRGADLTPAAAAVIFNQVVKYPPASLNRVFFALSDPTRRAVLARIAAGDMTVTAIAAPFAMSLAAVSKHIRVLELAGLLKRTRQGREHRLQFVGESLQAAAEWVSQFDRFWTDQLDRIKEAAERKASDRA